MAKFSHTPINFFLGLQVPDLHDWMLTISEEIQRQNKEIESAGKGGS